MVKTLVGTPDPEEPKWTPAWSVGVSISAGSTTWSTALVGVNSTSSAAFTTTNYLSLSNVTYSLRPGEK